MEYETAQGVTVPKLGLGTSGMTGDTCREAVLTALDLGYRHLDTAQMYDNEPAVGEAVGASDVDREDVFVTTKLLRRNLAYDDVHDSFADSLDRLDTGYVDLLLIHAPSDRVPVEETLRAMNELQADGEVRHVGVSNFSVSQTEAAIAASRTPVVTNQVLYHPFHSQHDLLAWCRDAGLVLTAYTPLAKGRVFEDDRLVEIGERYEKTPAQVALRWLIQQDGVVTIPQSSDPAHLAENLDVFDFALTDEEIATISGLSR